ncbi:hypothetical protein GGTG_12077 [Gaeumannomyces tritici R3-111a-1]|uniref:Uncharacterized protein n=1 Tax=Gaeumannomyces tritici (strain R3-111a-1) TaxID=644352 RepID=J3PEZ8_GAET3|nr:hypothetical protein GGTG_12077 [Gaeumannomyces tritici R3-111a-1]EJT71056.1 hypothetical protein GGTG_12077 [Gaeumannomyces tritici R3-111a-1]
MLPFLAGCCRTVTEAGALEKGPITSSVQLTVSPMLVDGAQANAQLNQSVGIWPVGANPARQVVYGEDGGRSEHWLVLLEDQQGNQPDSPPSFTPQSNRPRFNVLLAREGPDRLANGQTEDHA